MRTNTVIAGLILAGAGASSVLADGIEGSLKDTPVVQEHYGWSGLYFGGGGGFSSVDRSGHAKTDRTKKTEKCKDKNKKDCKDFEHVTTTTTSSVASFGDDDWDGFGTVQVGYDRLLHNHLLIGAFADFDLYDSGGGFGFADGNGTADLDWAWSVGGRLGVLVTPRVLLYGVGGYTQASLDGSVWIKNGPTLDHDDRVDGWFLGGGTEVKMRERVSLKFEYRYADYGGNSANGSSSSSKDYDCKDPAHKDYTCRDTDTVKSSSDLDLEVQSVRALVVVRLDHEERVMQPLK